MPANSDTSGRSRAPSLGTPGPVCQAGLAYPPRHAPALLGEAQLLGPPPAASRSTPSLLADLQPFSRPDAAQDSFQVVSGMYDLAEACDGVLFTAFQY